MNGTIERLTRPAKTGAYRPAIWGSRLGQILDGRPFFTWLEADRMRYDPQVQFGLRILRAPLYGVTWKVQADSALAERWIQREMGNIYRRMLPRLARHFEYGVSCGEVVLKARHSKATGRTRVHFHDYLEVHPRDAKPYFYGYGKRAGKLDTLEVRNSVSSSGEMGSSGTLYLDRRHAFWFKGDSEFGDWYGRPRLAGAYNPWITKAGRHGALDSIQLFYKKQAFKGPSLFYPPGYTDLGTPDTGPILKSNQDIAREIVEKFENGGVLAMPNVYDDKNNPLWRWEDPKAYADLTGLLEYKKLLDKDILIGLGIPTELVEAASVGSGYSGRAIPAQVFFCSMDEEAARIIEAIDLQILRWLVKLNFGPIGYAIVPDSLAQQVAKEPGGAGPPGAGPPGAGPPPGAQKSGPMRDTGPRGGHRLIDPKTGKVDYERQGGQGGKPRVRLSLTGDPSVSSIEARRLWDEATGPLLVPVGVEG